MSDRKIKWHLKKTDKEMIASGKYKCYNKRNI